MSLTFVIRQESEVSASRLEAFAPHLVTFDGCSTQRAQEYCLAISYKTGKDIRFTDVRGGTTHVVKYLDALALVKELEAQELRLSLLREFRIANVENGILNF